MARLESLVKCHTNIYPSLFNAVFICLWSPQLEKENTSIVTKQAQITKIMAQDVTFFLF